MSDWEDFCDDMGWANDEHATDKLINYIEDKGSGSYSSRRSREFTPAQKRAYAIKKAEERRLFATPIAQYVVSRFKGPVFNIEERTWTENDSTYKSMYFEIGKGGMFCLTVTKCNDASFSVEFCNLTGRKMLCTKALGNRLTPSLIEQAVKKNDEIIYANRRSR